MFKYLKELKVSDSDLCNRTILNPEILRHDGVCVSTAYALRTHDGTVSLSLVVSLLSQGARNNPTGFHGGDEIRFPSPNYTLLDVSTASKELVLTACPPVCVCASGKI